MATMMISVGVYNCYRGNVCRCMLLLSAFDSLLSLVFNFSLPSADKEDVTVAMQFYSFTVSLLALKPCFTHFMSYSSKTIADRSGIEKGSETIYNFSSCYSMSFTLLC